MEAKSVSEDDSSEASTSSGQKTLKPKRRSLVERELETKMTARVTSPQSFVEPGINMSRYGRARKIKSDKEFCNTNQEISNFLKSPVSGMSPKITKPATEDLSPKVASPLLTVASPLPEVASPLAKAENLIDKIHNENLSLSRFGSVSKSSSVKQDKTYIRKDLIQRKDEEPSSLMKNMFSPSKSPYKPSKSSHLKIFLERSSADKSGLEMNEAASMDKLFDTPDAKECASKFSRKSSRQSDTTIKQSKRATSASSSKSSSAKKSRRHTINVANAVVVKALDFNTKNNKEQTKKDLPKSKQPKQDIPKIEPIKMPTGGSKKNKSMKASVNIIAPQDPQGLLIEKTSVVKTLDFDCSSKRKPSNVKTTVPATEMQKFELVTSDTVEHQPESLLNQNDLLTNEVYEIEWLCEYNIGDLAWSRVGTYPFWPCIVTREPFTELFVKKKLFGRVERDVIHVTFFADNGRRGWIVDNMLRKYNGIDKFLVARDSFTVEEKKKDPKLYAAYFISDKKRDIWNQAVSEAEHLLKQPKLIRTDILYEMLSQNKNVKILKPPKIIKKVDVIENKREKVTLNEIVLERPKPVKLNRTDSDVSLSESLYDSLFSDDDTKTIDPEKSKNKSRKNSFDVSDVVTACLDNMAVKTGMAKIQKQSHMDRWLQKAKSQTPEKVQQIVLTPNKERKLSLSLRKKKKTPVKTITDKPYPLRKFAKESPDNGILNSYLTEHDYTKQDIENENPADNTINSEISVNSVDEAHYIESGTGIGTISAVESLYDKDDNQEKQVEQEMEISTIDEDKAMGKNELEGSRKTSEHAAIEITNANEVSMEVEPNNLINEESDLHDINLPHIDKTNTEISPIDNNGPGLNNGIKNVAVEQMDTEENTENIDKVVDLDMNTEKNIKPLSSDATNQTSVLSKENDQALNHVITKNDIELMETEPINTYSEVSSHTKVSNLEENNELLTLEATKELSKNISGMNRKDMAVTSADNENILEQNCLILDQTTDNSNTTENSGDINPKSESQESNNVFLENINSQKDVEMLQSEEMPDNTKTDNRLMNKINIDSKDHLDCHEIKDIKNQDCYKSNIGLQVCENMDENVNKDELNNKAKNDQQNCLKAKKEIITKTEVKTTTTRKSPRVKPEQITYPQKEDIINVDPITADNSTNNLDLENVIKEVLYNKDSVKNDLQNCIETKNKEIVTKAEVKTSVSRKSPRIKPEQIIYPQSEDIINDNSNIEPKTANNSINNLELPAVVDNKILSTSENGVEDEKKDIRRKSGRLSLNKTTVVADLLHLKKIPQVNLTIMNCCHIEINDNQTLNYSKKNFNDVIVKDIDKSCNVVEGTELEMNVSDIKNTDNAKTHLVENVLKTKQIVQNGFSDYDDHTSGKYAKLNGTFEIAPSENLTPDNCNTIPGKEVPQNHLKIDEQNVRKSKRIKIKRNSKKSIDKERGLDGNKMELLQNMESDHETIGTSPKDITVEVIKDNVKTDERESKAKPFEKEINLITSVFEPALDSIEHDKCNDINVNNVITNATNVNELSPETLLNSLCDQKTELTSSLAELNSTSKSIDLVGSIPEKDLPQLINGEASPENVTPEALSNKVDEHVVCKDYIESNLSKFDKPEINTESSNKVDEKNKDDRNNKINDYENLELTPEKIMDADVIIENGNTDTNEEISLMDISVISTVDTSLERKRRRPRKSNNLIIDNVVIEEINLTGNLNNSLHVKHDNKAKADEDWQPRKKGRPKKCHNTALHEPGNVLTNGYHEDTDSLPEFAHLMDLDVSLDGADFNQSIQVENIALLTDAEVLAKVTEANFCNKIMNVDDCQEVSLSNEDNIQTGRIAKQASIHNKISECAYALVPESQPIVDISAQTPTVVALNNKDTSELKNSETEAIEKTNEIQAKSQNIESISLSSISIKSEIESTSSSYAPSEYEDKQSLNDEDSAASEKISKENVAETHEEIDQETQNATSKRKQRVKPENKLTTEVYKALDDPEFAKYLEIRQDALIDENPHVSQDDVVKYLYKTWIYEQSLKSVAVKSDDLIEINLVKGLGNKSTSPPKKIKKRIKSQADKEEKYEVNEVIIPRDRSKRKTATSYLNADDTDIEDELEVFEIFKNKNKAKKVTPTTPSTTQSINEQDIPKDDKTESELDDIPLANLISDKNTQSKPEDLTEKKEDVLIEKPFDQVEYYFSQLTQPKPNVFKGLVRERVCDICFKTSNLVKCRGPCNGMFHIDCVKKETTPVSVQNLWIRGRKKKKPRGPRPKNRSQDDSQSDDKDLNNVDDILDSTLSVPIDAENFESQLEERMKEILEKAKVNDLASSDEELKWDDADPGKCEIVNITLKTRRNPNNDFNFKCNDCLKLTIPKCYVCKSEKSPKNSVELRQRCQIAQCNKYYHLECLDMWPQTQFNQGESLRKTTDLFDILSCPRHVCHSCVCDDPRGCNTRFSGEKLARCVKCPATYHSFTKCLPAGSQLLSASHIICPRHTVNRPGKVPCHVNTGWCFICALGGSLICCEYCPTSFHADCLNIAPPEGNYMCEDCETGRLPLYGEMVWVKLGHYRWWPGLVLHPCEIPDNINCMKHSPGDFVVRFFGQYDHYWVNRGRVFPFQEGDSGRISSQKSKIDEAFTLAIEHAKRAFQILKTAPPNSEEEAEIATSFLPPQYVKLRVNKPCGSVTILRGDEEMNGLSQCDCDPRAERPCDVNTQCLNRMLLTECGPSCRAGDRCQNRAFEKRLYPKMAPYRTPHRGWGLRTLEDVKAGQFVIEYVGELIDETEFKRRMQLKHEIRDENYYFLTLDKERMIDAGPKGNLARFMNHSCEPNCETQKWTVLGDVRVGLFAIHDIPAFTEVTFNYNLECAGIDKKRCMCGAPRCSGYIGAKPKTLEEINPKKKDLSKKRIYNKRKKEDSPSTTKIKIPKPRTTTRSKPKELTEIEKDLLIIKNATNGIPSSDSECSLKVNLNLEENRAVKRKRSSSIDTLMNSDELGSSEKVLKLDMFLESESASSEGNR